MNLKEKINLIKNEIKNETPEVNRDYILKTAIIDSNSKTSNPFPRYHRYILRTVFTFALICVFGLFLSLNFQNKYNDEYQNNNPPNSDKPYNPGDDEKSFPIGNFSKYAFAAKSLASIYANNLDFFDSFEADYHYVFIPEMEINVLNRYMKTFELFFKEPLETPLPSNNDDFLYLTKYTAFDILDQEHVFYIYHNENKLDCLVIYNDQEYNLKGTEISDDKFFFKIYNNPMSFIEFSTDNEYYYCRFNKDGFQKHRSRILIVEGEDTTIRLENYYLSSNQIHLYTITKNLDQNQSLSIVYQVHLFLVSNPSHSGNNTIDYDTSIITNEGTIVVDIKNDNATYYYQYEVDSKLITKER